MPTVDVRPVREALGVTQTELAERLEMGQGAISRLERQDDMLVGTLIKYMEALGVRLVIVARMEDGDYDLTGGGWL